MSAPDPFGIRGITEISRSPRTATSTSPGVSICSSLVSPGRSRTSMPAAAGVLRPNTRELAAVTREVGGHDTAERTGNILRPRAVALPHTRWRPRIGKPCAVRAEGEAGHALVASFGEDKGQRPLPELTQGELPDLLTVPSLQGRESIGEGQRGIPFFLDLCQREKLLRLGAMRLLHRSLLRGAAPHPQLAHDREDHQERSKRRPDAETRSEASPACLLLHRTAECLLGAVSLPV